MATIPDLPFVDPASLDFTQCVADIHKIREINPHRHEVEMLTAVTHINERGEYRRLQRCEGNGFLGTRAHARFPSHARCHDDRSGRDSCGFYLKYMGIIKDATLGLAGVEMAKFKRMVPPGDRLILIGHGLKVDRRLSKVYVVGYVDNEEAFRAIVVGAPLKIEEMPGA